MAESMEWSDIPHKSEILAAEALACDLDKWITYKQTDQPLEEFEKWLNNNLPSSVHRSDGIGWICVRGNRSHGDEDEDEGVGDLETLHQMWEDIQKSGRPINANTIADLAKICKVTYGKWLFYVDSGGKADHLWSIVARGVVNNLIPSTDVKVSPLDDMDQRHDRRDKYQHVICVYNNNFLDQEEVLACENGLRTIGIKCPLMYKPDVYTYLGIYRDNPWDLRPTIYRSEFEITTRQSKIDSSSAPFLYDR